MPRLPGRRSPIIVKAVAVAHRRGDHRALLIVDSQAGQGPNPDGRGAVGDYRCSDGDRRKSAKSSSPGKLDPASFGAPPPAKADKRARR
jgi:hypothetical protein